jgi:DNA (cytosine-5)-methyltransferase 1
MEKYTVVDLFAGAGGLSYGFMQTGSFRLVAAAEINASARETYKKNIVGTDEDFSFINNVVGYNFAALGEKFGGIDIVIGGPPCQGFSNANRQKNHLISMNNGLVKEYFRAIKEMKPRAFVMENVSMLRSDTHRFYESLKDNAVIDQLIEQGHSIPKRKDSIFICNLDFGDIKLDHVEEFNAEELKLPTELTQLLSVLNKNKNNDRRLPNYLQKHSKEIIRRIDEYGKSSTDESSVQQILIQNLSEIRTAVVDGAVLKCANQLEAIVKLQKAISTIAEIRSNELIGQFRVADNGGLYFDVNSYSVIDYINAILGDEYIQNGNTINAEWFGVPQERRRYIIIGIRKDLFNKDVVRIPEAPENLEVITVGEAIADLQGYDVAYTPSHPEIEYNCGEILHPYAQLMRENSSGVNNHITTKTTDVALKRFKSIGQGKNFHSLDSELKNTYSKPERTQNTIYLRLDPQRPSGTVVNVRKSMWIHPYLDRAITVREAARLQSFPDRFIFTGPKDAQYQQVGNAVPPLLAEAIAKKVLENLE